MDQLHTFFVYAPQKIAQKLPSALREVKRNKLKYNIMKLNKALLAAAAVAIGFMAASCSGGTKKLITEFKRSIFTYSADKVIDQKEFETLKTKLGDITAKSREGVKIGVEVIKDEESLIGYLEKKDCEIEGLRGSGDEVTLDDFYICMENSASMKGYFGKGNPDFSEPIIALFQCDAKSVHTSYVGGKGQNDPEVTYKDVTNDAFLQNIAQGKFSESVSSPIDKIIEAGVETILDDEDESDDDDRTVDNVFCLITDGLLSGTNQEIIANREFTKNSLPVLENRIRDAVEEAYEYHLDCLVYRLETPFNGTYYDYRNGKHTLSGGVRPYFMIMIGDKENLQRIENVLSKETNFTNHTSQRFASYDVSSTKTISKASLAQIPGQANVIASGNTVRYKPGKIGVDPVVFTVKMQLKDLNSYYKDIVSLENDLRLEYYDKPSNTEVEIPSASWLADINLEEETETYTFTVSLDNEYLKKMRAEKTGLTLTLPGHQDRWYVDLSSPDDSQIAVGETTTFGLDRLMGGIMKGFGYQDNSIIPDAIKVEFTLVKEN